MTWEAIDTAQFGPFAIVVIMLIIALGFMTRQWLIERKRTDEAVNGRLQDAKESRETIIEPLNSAVATTRLIYDLLTNSDRRK